MLDHFKTLRSKGLRCILQNSCSYYFLWIKKVTCSFRKMLENFFWTLSLLMQLLFRYFLQGFYLDSKLLFLLHFRFPRACIFQNTSFSHPFMVAGLGITRQLVRWKTVVLLILFTFLGCLRLPESSIKIWSMMLMG